MRIMPPKGADLSATPCRPLRAWLFRFLNAYPTHRMIAPKDSIEPQSSDALPNSRKIYVAGKLHPDIRVPLREISLSPTRSSNGIEVNESVRVYDTSGPWGDPDFSGDVEQGLPPLRAKWIRDRSDVEEYEGRAVTPIDDGYLSIAHAERSVKRNGNLKFEIRDSKLAARRSLR